eukprot:scaffold3838_cov65-Phaeocystis_antarctica.AAC.7
MLYLDTLVERACGCKRGLGKQELAVRLMDRSILGAACVHTTSISQNPNLTRSFPATLGRHGKKGRSQ